MQVLETDGIAANNILDLLTNQGYVPWMAAQQVKGPGQRYGRSLVTCHHELQALNLYLFLAHTPARVVIGRVQHETEKIGIADTFLASCRNVT